MTGNNKMKFKDWYDRSSASENGGLDKDGFIRTSDRFVTLANTLNRKIIAQDIQYTLLFAAARYSSHVGKNVMEVAPKGLVDAYENTKAERKLKEDA